MIAQKFHIGIDISKNFLDIYLYNHKNQTDNHYFRTENNPQSIKKLIKQFSQISVEAVTLEASGGYERTLIKYLHQADFVILRPNAMNVRLFARGCNIKAKTDKADARILAIFGCLSEQYELIQTTAHEEELKELMHRREIICEQRKQEKTRFSKAYHSLIKKMIQQNIKNFEKQLLVLEKEIHQLIKQHKNLLERYKILCSIPGIGDITACYLICNLRELGLLDNKKIASLCGVAPFTRESGNYRGKSYIKGGRKNVRNKLYMCALSAMRISRFKKMYDQMIERGKPPKVALVAIMRKLIIIANSLIKKNEYFTNSKEENIAII